MQGGRAMKKIMMAVFMIMMVSFLVACQSSKNNIILGSKSVSDVEEILNGAVVDDISSLFQEDEKSTVAQVITDMLEQSELKAIKQKSEFTVGKSNKNGTITVTIKRPDLRAIMLKVQLMKSIGTKEGSYSEHVNKILKDDKSTYKKVEVELPVVIDQYGESKLVASTKTINIVCGDIDGIMKELKVLEMREIDHIIKNLSEEDGE